MEHLHNLINNHGGKLAKGNTGKQKLNTIFRRPTPSRRAWRTI